MHGKRRLAVFTCWLVFAGLLFFAQGVSDAAYQQTCLLPDGDNLARIPYAEASRGRVEWVPGISALTADLVINEIDYDQPGTDQAEFIEIKNITGTLVNLDAYEIRLVNGTGGGASVYRTVDLPNVNLAAGDYYVVCGNMATVANCDLEVAPDTNLIQNGPPDAVALATGGTVVDTVSYEGDTGTPYTEGSGVGLEDDPDEDQAGISRFPDGTDTDQNNADLSLRCMSPGAANRAANANCVPPLWNFLIYLIGDNDLEDALWPTLADLTTASSSVPDGQALVLWDGDGGSDSALYHIRDGRRIPLAAPWLGLEANMGNPNTLVDFVQWAWSEYPAGHTFLAVLDHGGGWSPTIEVEGGRLSGQAAADARREPLAAWQLRPDTLFPSLAHYRFKGGTGMAWDLHTGTGDSDYISTAELRGAIETATYSGTRPIDVLFYDACLMGMLEEIHDFGPYVNYFVASENEAWASGAYGDYLATLGPTTTPAEMAVALVATYEASLQQAGADEHPYTLSALDLSHMDAISTTFGTLAQRLHERVGDATLRGQIYMAYANAQKLDSDSDLVLEPDRESYVDLYHLALNLSTMVTDTDVTGAADALLAAWDGGLVLAEAHHSGTAWHSGEYWDLDNAHGLSVYLPLGEELTMVITHTSGLTEAVPIRSLYSLAEAPNRSWRDFINDYIAAAGGRPVAYLVGPRDGLLTTKARVYLPTILRGSEF